MSAPHEDGDRDRGDQLMAVWEAMAEAMRPVFAEMGRRMRAIQDALGGPEGIAAMIAELERAQAAERQWEAEHPGIRFGQNCYCWCAVRGHAGVCTGRADTLVTRSLPDGLGPPVRIPMCPPCAALPDRPRLRPGGSGG